MEIAERQRTFLRLKVLQKKFYNYMDQGFYSLSSPVWSNFGKKRGLPISCFGSNIVDDMGNILYSQSEVKNDVKTWRWYFWLFWTHQTSRSQSKK